MTREEILKNAKPILFNTEMVQAIQNGTKTATRQVAFPNKDLREFHCKDYPEGWWFRGNVYSKWKNCEHGLKIDGCWCNYKAGDLLYVRETWAFRYCCKCDRQGAADECELERQIFEIAPFGYRGCFMFRDEDDDSVNHQWHSAKSMPKEAARIFLRVTDIKIERLQDITIEGSIKEGCLGVPCDCADKFIAGGTICCVDCMNTGWQESPTVEFREQWDSTIKKSDLEKYGWKANPWVYVIQFERLMIDETM